MRKKQISFILAAAMVLTMLSGCNDKSTQNQTETETAAAEITETAEESVTSAINIFDENYDPLANDYDPYGNNANNASSDTIKAETIASNTITEDETNAVTTSNETSSNNEKGSDTQEMNKSTEKKASSDASLILNVSNSWDDGTNDFIQLDGTVKNNQSKNISNWSAEITVSSSASIDQSWNCELSISNGKISVKPVDYNKVQAGGEVTFGIILKNAGSFDSSKSNLKFDNSSVSATGSNNNNNNNSSNNSNSGSVGNNNPKIVQAKDVPEPTTDDWLYVKGNKIVDSEGKEVWLTGVNWFGYNTGTNTFDGLWACDLNSSIASIADRGFNLLRVPISTELIKQWSNGEYPSANFNQATNSYLVGMNSLEIFDYVVGQCRANGIKIMIDIHCAKTDSMGHMKNMWYEGNISEKDYLDSLKWIAKRYKNDDTIIAYDLKNEPHGKANESPRAKWDNSTDSDNWKYIAEKAAKSVFAGNPNALVMVEGIEIYPTDIKKNGDFSSTNMGDYYCTWWGGNLRGVKDNPVDLGKYQNKLVYSPHDYGPAVYQQPWFQGNYDFNSLYNDCWYDNWFYIQKNNIAPLLIGEWGGYMTEPNVTWMKYLRKLIKDNKINHTFWCFNANSGDTGGLVKDDFTTWDEEKYAFVKEVLWQQDGKFVGLDHEIPLGSNGMRLSDAK